MRRARSKEAADGRITLRFAALSFVAFLAVGLATHVLFARHVALEADRQAEFHATFVVDTVLAELLRPSDLEAPVSGARYEELRGVVVRELLQDPVFRVKVWAPDGTVLFPDEPRLIGQVFSDEVEELEEVLEGRVESGPTDLSHEENEFERGLASDVFQTYVPLRVPGAPPAIAEVYQDYGPAQRAATITLRKLDGILGLGLFLLYALVLPIARRTARSLAERSARLRILHETDQAILAARSPEEIAGVAMERVCDLVPCRWAAVAMFDPETEQLFVLASFGRPVVPGGTRLPREIFAGLTPAGAGLTHPRAGAADPDRLIEALRGEGLAWYLSVPLAVEMRVIGAVIVASPSVRGFSERYRQAVRQVADQLAVAIQQARLREELAARATELEQRLAELRRADEERRRLLAHVVEAQERERQGIAADIHDDSVQAMAALGMRLGVVKRRIQDPGQFEELAGLERVVQETTERLRSLMFDLRPPALDRDGLVAALDSAVRRARAGSGLAYEIESELAVEPPEEVRTILYRIAQEALSNVRKHAGARNVRVSVGEAQGGVVVRIRDDGAGFVVGTRASSPPGHLGLVSMRERAEMAGGWCRVESAPGAGTTVEIWIPLRALAGPLVSDEAVETPAPIAPALSGD